MYNDVRYALRGFRRNPIFALTAILTIGLGIGATTAVFSVVDRILFRSLPYPGAERLVFLGMAAPIEPREFLLGADYLEWRAHQTPFEAMTSWSGISECDLTEQDPVRLTCAQVEASFLPTLGVQPLLGRNFTREEDRPNAPRVVLLSHGLWQSRFGGERSAVGATISLDGQRTRVVGILPANFEFPTLVQIDVMVPQALDDVAEQRPNTRAVLRVLARLKPGVNSIQAQAALDPLFQQSLRFVPPQFRKEVKLRVRSLHDLQIQDARLASWVLLAAVAAVLLIACANVANLLLARSTSRQREFAVRLALGARPVRLIRQTLTESLLLGLIGGGVGCVLADLLLRFFVVIAPNGILRLQQAGLDGRVLLFAVAVSLLSGLLFGLAPALRRPELKALTGSRSTGASRNFFRQSLVAAQIAGSLILLSGASLLLRSFWNMLNLPLGMRTDSVLTASVMLGQQRYAHPPQRLAFFEEVEARLRRLPGVVALAVSDSLPPGGRAQATIYSRLDVAGRAPLSEGTGGMVVWRSVTPEYFSALNIPIVSGRGFQEVDRNSSENSVILSASLARRLFPDRDPLLARIRPGGVGPWLTVIGIAGDVANAGLNTQNDPEYYIVRKHGLNLESNTPVPPEGQRSANVIFRTSIDPQAVAAWVRSEIAAIDPSLPISFESMGQRVGKLAQRPQFNAFLLSLFAGLAVLLAAIGLYGVMSFLVVQRTQEIAIRMALGATPRQVMIRVLAQAGRWVIAGILLGLIGSHSALHLLGNMLFGAPERDPLTLGVAVALLVVVAFLAASFPAWRASHVDPMVALRYE
jgi:putative ABC transport system permease protein